MAHEFNMNVNLTTILYSYYQFIGKNKPKLRHLMTPTIGYRFVPLLNPLQKVNADVNQTPISYSSYERSIYNVGNTNEASFLTFGINNTFEMKYKSDKDTITGFKKVRLVDQLSINGNYDFTKDSMRLSNISLNLRISPFDWLNFVSSASFSPYAWMDSTGKNMANFAIQNGQGLGRFLNTNLNTSITLAPKKSREKIQENGANLNDNWRSDYNYFALHPEQAIYFDIPWKMSFSHVLSFTANQAVSIKSPDSYLQIQTLVINSDISFTKRWNISGNINLNLKDKRLTNAYFSLNRNLHCWMLSFYWVPIGGNKSFLFSIRNSSSMLKDAKLEIRRPPAFL
jgi:hypothetical protein